MIVKMWLVKKYILIHFRHILPCVHIRSQSDWWYAKSISTNREGYVPSNYVALEDSPEKEG